MLISPAMVQSLVGFLMGFPMISAPEMPHHDYLHSNNGSLPFHNGTSHPVHALPFARQTAATFNLLGNDLFGAGVGLMALFSILKYAGEQLAALRSALSTVSDVTVDGESEAYAFIAEYLAENPDAVSVMLDPMEATVVWVRSWLAFIFYPVLWILHGASTAKAKKRRLRRHGHMLAPVRSFVCQTTYEAHEDYDSDSDYEDASDNKPALRFVPSDGTYVVRFPGGAVHVVNSKKDDKGGGSDNSDNSNNGHRHGGGGGGGGSGSDSNTRKMQFTIIVPGDSDALARDFIRYTMGTHYVSLGVKTHVFIGRDYGWRASWEKCASRTPRSLDSIVLRQDLKEDLLRDIQSFLASESWYAERGIPYRRGYLLHGPPGTGKTSSIFAIASALGMNVCIANLATSGLTDTGLQFLLTKSPRRSILLFEDVDVALPKPKGASKSKSDDDAISASSVTISGLLNALDGIAAQEGRVVFLTTNSVSSLPPALLRPGRCDRRFLFDHADGDVIARLYERFFASDLGEDEARRIGRAVSEKIPKEAKLSAAQLQGLFIRHRDDPRGILGQVEGFLEECERHRKEDEETRRLEREALRKKKEEEEEDDSDDSDDDEDDDSEDEDEAEKTKKKTKKKGGKKVDASKAVVEDAEKLEE
ncbi:hypothetical protein HK101_003589 [Irineochytrium annulatum]|nr:hypothetical protein HK101_003589 [Irineochytrium annulatum]